MGGSSGGTPSIGAGQGFFPTQPQFNFSALPIWDMANLAQSLYGPAPRALPQGSIFGPRPQQPQQQPQPQQMQAPPPSASQSLAQAMYLQSLHRGGR